MFKSVTEYIERITNTNGSKTNFSDKEIAEAIASIFKQMVLSDGIIRDEEIASAVNHLVTKYGYLEKGEHDHTLLEEFKTVSSESLFPIAFIINQSMNNTQRKQLKIHLMATALADREFHPYEQEFMDLIEKLIKT